MKTIACNFNRKNAQIYQIKIVGTLQTVSSSVNKESVKQIIKQQKNKTYFKI